MFRPNSTIKNLAFICGVIALSFGFSYAVFAVWQEPILNPPDGNAVMPLNAGTIGQSKASWLNSTKFFVGNAPTAGEQAAVDGYFRTSAGAYITGSGTTGLIVANGNVGIGTASPEFKLSLDNDGGIIAKGIVGSGADLISSGAGARMIWYPKKAAFRVGSVSGNQWDNVNIGGNSFAAGFNTMATGIGSLAIGNNNRADGIGSVALTDNASAVAYSVAMGHGASAAGGYSFALGRQMKATAEQSFMIGGVLDDTFSMTNNIPHSLMIGFDSNIPALFVGPGIGATSGNVGIGTTAPKEKLEVDGGIRLNTTNVKPVCDANKRGVLWYSQGPIGVKDSLDICAKDNGGLYAWRTLY